MVEKYPLDILIKARKTREDRARMEFISAKGVAEDIENTILETKEEINHYGLWRKEEEARKFAKIRNKSLSQKELDAFNRDLLSLKARHIEMEERVVELDAELEQAKERIIEKEKLYKEAITQKEKIEEHKELWTEEYNKELARLEDVELEEFTGKKPEDFDEDIGENED